MGKGLSIIAFVLSMLFFVPFAPIAGIILGIIAVAKAKNKEDLKGLAIAAIIIGAILMIFNLLIIISYFSGVTAQQSGANVTDEKGIFTLDISGTKTQFKFINESSGVSVPLLPVGYALNKEKSAGVILVVDPTERFPPQFILIEGEKKVSSGITGDDITGKAVDAEDINEILLSEDKGSVIHKIIIKNLEKFDGASDVSGLVVLAAKALDQSGLPIGEYAGKLSSATQRIITKEEADEEVSVKNRLGEKVSFESVNDIIKTKGESLKEITPAGVFLDLLNFVVDKNAVSVCGLPGEKIVVTEIPDLITMYSCKTMYISDYIPMQITANAKGVDERGLPLDPTKSSLDLVSREKAGLGITLNFDENGKINTEIPEGVYFAKVTSPGFAPYYREINQNANNLDITLQPLDLSGGTDALLFFIVDLPSATKGEYYQYSFCDPELTNKNSLCGGITETNNPVGGNPPYHFQLASGTGFPPMGLVLSPNGILSGTVTSNAGTYCFGVDAVDLSGNMGSVESCVPVNNPETVPPPNPPNPPSGKGQCSGMANRNACGSCNSNADCGGSNCYTSVNNAPFC